MNKQLITQIEGQLNSYRNGWINEEGFYGNLLIILYSNGYLKKVEEHYIKEGKWN